MDHKMLEQTRQKCRDTAKEPARPKSGGKGARSGCDLPKGENVSSEENKADVI